MGVEEKKPTTEPVRLADLENQVGRAVELTPQEKARLTLARWLLTAVLGLFLLSALALIWGPTDRLQQAQSLFEFAKQFGPPVAIESIVQPGQAQQRFRSAAASAWMTKLQQNFEDGRSTHAAAELVETAAVLGRGDEVANAQTAYSRTPQSVVAARATAITDKSPLPQIDLLDDGENLMAAYQIAGQCIGKLRSRLHKYAGQPLLWSELARHYVIVGEDKKASNAMRCALKLAGPTRYLHRAAARMYIHLGESEQALAILRSHPDLKRDPWLLSAEIATASVARRPSRHLLIAAGILDARHFPARHISELASAVATVELMNGNGRRAKKLFAQSLIDPTENSLAQAEWATEKDSLIRIPDRAWQTPVSHEANALVSRSRRDWDSVIQTSALWLADEPYSIRPAALGSCLAFIRSHAAAAERFASAGLYSNPQSAFLLNNRAVARAYLGRIIEAYQDLERALAQPSERDNPYHMATLGLVAFRSGEFELGRDCYEHSLSWFSSQKARGSMVLAFLHWLREEIHIRSDSVEEGLSVARDLIKTKDPFLDPEISSMMEMVEEEASIATNAATKQSDILIPLARPSREQLDALAARINMPAAAIKLEAKMKA